MSIYKIHNTHPRPLHIKGQDINPHSYSQPVSLTPEEMASLERMGIKYYIIHPEEQPSYAEHRRQIEEALAKVKANLDVSKPPEVVMQEATKIMEQSLGKRVTPIPMQVTPQK